ncbi:MAG: UDP-N-acetylmuramate--L-alanine ligase [bacterium]|nr:UDP-N-acetylmuramate--L-alanine ligase [bacterium]
MQRRLSPLHFVGVGGIGMAALAELFHAQGHAVSGSDLVASPTFERLRELGLDVRLGHDAEAVEGAETVVRSSAISEDNPEIAAARDAGIPIVGRGALLAEVMRTRDAIAIGGSHGKTTTSAMTAHLLEAAGLDPTALIGGRVPRASGGASPVKLGQGDLIVAEVDESDGSFLLTRPVLAVVNNVDPEHLDHYGTREALLDAFVDFANSVPFYGACVLGIDHPGVQEIAPRITSRIVHFGFDASADVRAERVEPISGGQRVKASLRNRGEISFDLPMPGRHNVLNALAAIAVGVEQGVDPAILAEAVASFAGVSRRYERKGEASGVQVVDDYAHHPAEIRAALAGARSLHAGRITAIFQPHRYTRTRDCWDEFLTAFEDADRVVLADVYAASETPLEGIDAARLADAVRATGHPDVRHGGPLDAIAASLPAELEDGDLVLTLGAGDVVSLGPRLLEALEAGADA